MHVQVTSSLTLTLEHADCHTSSRCVITTNSLDAGNLHTLDVTYMSYRLDASNAQQSSVLQSQPGFIGCMRDIRINDDHIIPAGKIDSQEVSIRC